MKSETEIKNFIDSKDALTKRELKNMSNINLEIVNNSRRTQLLVLELVNIF
jgi:hypothetical protein